MAIALRGLLRTRGVWVALFMGMLFTAAPGVARAQATCAIDFSVNYNSTSNAHVMSMTSNFDEFAACDPRYVANPGDPASGFTPYVQNGASANGGSFSTQVNAADDTIIYNAPTGFSGIDTFTVYFCNDAGCSAAGARVATVSVTVGTPTIVVSPTTLPNATVAAAYSQTMTGSGGQAPYHSFIVTSGALPAGLTLASGGGLTGTPTASGVFNFTIRTTDTSTGNGPFQGSRAYTMTVAAPTVVVNPTTLPAATVGAAYSQAMTGAGGTAPYGNFIVSAGALPAGLSLNSSSGALTGTPTAGGTFNFTIRTTDSTTGTGPHNGSRAYSMTVNAPTITVSPTTLPAGAQGSAYSQTITASGGTAPYSFAVTSGTLPTGLTLAAGGALTGTPTVNGSFPITITATDSSTGTASPYTGARGYTLVINAPPAPVANAVSRTVAYNSTANAVTLNITGGTPTSVATPGLPSNGTVNVAGTSITYTPTTGYAGPDSFTYTATNGGGTSAPATVTITVSPPTISVSPTTLPNGTTGVAYSQNVTAAGGSGSYTYAVTAGAQPTGLTLSAAGLLSGTPSGTGPYTFTVTATDTASTGPASPFTGARAYTVTIVTPDPAIANPVSATVAYNSSNNPITLNITGGAPTSVAVSTAATNGTATAAGTSITYTPTLGYFGPDSFAYTATNADGTSAPATVTITVNPQPPIAGAVTATVAQDSGSNPITLNITGGTPTSVNGSAVVNGSLVVAGTSISFTPTPGYNGPASFSYTATNAGGTSAPATVSITVNPLPPIAGAVSATVAYGSSNNPITLNVTGGTPTSVATPIAPANGTASIAGTAITYTPTTGYFGGDSFTYTATNAGGTSAPATVTITVNPQPPIAGAVTASVVQDSSNNPITLNISGGTPTSVNGSAVVNGSLVVAGTSISFTPTPGYNGPASFSYTATNAGGTSAPATVSITVNPFPPVANDVSVTVAFESANNPVTLNITGGTATSVATPSLPANGTVSIAGLSITYTPTAGYAGSDSFTYTATNTGGTSAPATVSITVSPPPPPITGAVSATVAANNSNNPITLSLTGGTAVSLATPGLPSHGAVSIAGLSITYTPTAGYSGADSFTYTATNLGGTSAPATVSITVSQPTLTLSALSTTGTVTAAYSSTVTASLGTAPYSYAVTAGAVPPGLTLGAGGLLSGTATDAGTFNFTVTATDALGATGSQAYAITVAPPTVTISSPPAGALPSVEAYGAYSETFTVAGGAAPRTVALTAGAFPPGLALAGGVLSGAPTTPGTYNFSLTPGDGSAAPGPYSGAPVAYSITVTAPMIGLSPAAGALPAATTALAYGEIFTASGGIGPYGYSVTAGALPTGLTLSAGGALSGTPTASGTYNFTVTAEDSHAFSAATAYSITVSDPVITITAPAAGALPSVEAYGSYTETFTSSGGIGPRTFALTAGVLPPGIGFTSAGVLSGTPTTPGAYNFSITASDSSGAPGPFTSAPSAYSITVTAPTIGLNPAAGALPAATTALAYGETFTATSGIGPYGYSVTAGALPPGLGLSGAGGLSGAPTASGTYNFTVTATDSHGFSTANAYSITVTDPTVTLTSPAAGALPSVEAYTAYSETFTASGGTGPRTFALTAGALPPGLTLGGGGILSGTPTTPGTYNFSIAASDSSGAPGPFASAAVAYSITVTAPTITLAPSAGPLAPATTAQAYGETFAGSGGIGPYGYAVTAGALPPGLTLLGGGAFSGAPTAAGTYNFTVTATDSHGFTGANAYAITVADPVVTLTSPAAGALPSVGAYTAYSQTFTAAGGVTPHSFALTAGALPPGLSLVGSALSGTPTTPGTYNFSIAAADSSGAPGPFVSAAVAYSITVSAPTVTLAPTAGALAAATSAQPYSETFVATGGVGPYGYTITAGALPPGLTLAGGGALSGAPTAAGTFNFTVTATDSHGFSAVNAYAITVTDPVVTVTAPAAGALPGATAYAAYSQTFTAAGGVAPHSFTVTAGALPAGLGLSAAGVLSGAPTAAGTFNFSISAADSSGAPGPFVSAPTAYSLTVAAPSVTITAPVAGALPDGTASAAYSQTFTAAGGSGTHSFALTAGALPPGMSFGSAGVLSGTPTTPGTYNFSIVASDTSVAPGPFSSAPSAYSLTIAAPTVAITAPAAGALPDAVAFTAVSQTFTATGGAGAHSFALTAGVLPPGVSFSSAGVLSGTPTATGTYNFTIVASDSSGAPGPFTSPPTAYSLTVTAPTLAVTPPALPDAVTEVVFGQALSAGGGVGPYSFALTSGALPPGITLAATGAISGDPTTAGTYNFTVTVTDANGFTGLRAYSLIVVQAVPVAQPDAASTPANQAVAIPVTANDTGVITSIAVAGAPANGTAVVSGLDVTYTPATDFFGVDSFTYTATGPGGTSAPAVVTVTVAPLAVPTAAAKTLTVLAGQSASVLATDGSTGAPITAVAIAAAPAHGTATVAGQDLVYTPSPGYSGADSFTYTLANPFGVSAPATVTVTVNPAPITAGPITVEILSGQTATVSLTAGAAGGPFTAAALVGLTPPAAGTASITNPGAGQYGLTFTPAGEFAGTVTATYSLSNAFATSAPGTVTIIVTARPDPSADPEVTGLIGAQGESARRFATAQIGNFNSRLESLRDAGGGGTSLSLGFAGGSRDITEELDSTTRRRLAELGLLDGPALGVDRIGEAGVGGAGAGGGTANAYDGGGGGGSDTGRVGLWAAGMVDFGQRDAARNQKGVKFTTDGLTAGADLRLGDQLVIGAGIGWGHDESRIGHNGTRSEADGYSFAVYGSYQPAKTFFIDGVLGYGTLEFDSRRYITATGDFALGQRDGSQWFGAVTGGWDMREGRWQLSPYGRLSATRSQLDAFDETTGGAYALSYDSQTVRTLTGTFGLRGAYGYRVKLGEITPRFRFEYSHDFEGAGRARLSYLDWVGGPVYGVYAAPLDVNRVLGGLGLDIVTTGGTRFTIDYETMLGSTSEQQQIRLQIQTRF